MTRRAYLYFALTFLFGIVVGSAGTYYYAWHHGLWHRRPSKERVISHLKRELNLSDTQVQQLNQIMDEAGQKHRQLQGQIDPQFRALHDETNGKIRTLLNPDQLTKFNELVRQSEERRRRAAPPPP